ncbi:MAG: hypothetical protein MJ137_03875 [Clostridia bacterium]|nr:hypothetical protein [Clostridia bacterium]
MFDKELCIRLLREKGLKLKESGDSRFPRKSDFSPEETAAIKAFLGPWPRALESAGLKEPPAVTSKEKNRQRRIRSKRRLNEKRTNGFSAEELSDGLSANPSAEAFADKK